MNRREQNKNAAKNIQKKRAGVANVNNRRMNNSNNATSWMLMTGVSEIIRLVIYVIIANMVAKNFDGANEIGLSTPAQQKHVLYTAVAVVVVSLAVSYFMNGGTFANARNNYNARGDIANRGAKYVTNRFR